MPTSIIKVIERISRDYGKLELSTNDFDSVLTGNVDFSSLSSQVLSNDVDIDSLSSSIDINTTNITNNDSDLSSLSAAIDVNTDGISGNDADIIFLSGEVDGKSDIGHTHTKVDVTDFDDAISGKVDKISAVSGNLAALSGDGSLLDSGLTNNSADWNANRIQGKNISSSAPSDNQILKFNASSDQYEPADESGGSGVSGTRDILTWVVSGGLAVDTEQDGFRAVAKNGKITNVIGILGGRGDDGNTIIDINKHVPTKPITTQRNNTVGTTIYTTQGNRPNLSGLNGSETDNAIIEAATPEVSTFVVGDFFSMDVDSKASSSRDLIVQLHIQYT